jgi:hypothetical protein
VSRNNTDASYLKKSTLNLVIFFLSTLERHSTTFISRSYTIVSATFKRRKHGVKRMTLEIVERRTSNDEGAPPLDPWISAKMT